MDTILYGGDGDSGSTRSDGYSVSTSSHCNMYYNMEVWGRERDKGSECLPLYTAAAIYLTVNMPTVHEVNMMTGLPVFVQAAVGPTSDIESIYNLLR